MFKEPRNLGELVRIVDENHPRFGCEGYKFRMRISDCKVLVYFPIKRNRGDIGEFDWEQCERVIEGGIKLC